MSLNPISTLTIAGFSPSQCDALLAHARALQHAADLGQVQPLLRGKNLGVLCEAGGDPDAFLLRHAAMELGAKVTCLRPSLSQLASREDIQHTAHVLGRLYDALACQGVPDALIHQLGLDAGVPVYDNVASPGHASARLAEQLAGNASAADKHRFVLQALLLATMP